MDELHLSYLKVLTDLAGTLDQLSQLAQQKADAVRNDDLISLDEVLKQEQALSLNLRGLEQRRLKLVPQLGLVGVRLEDLPQHYPSHLEDEATRAMKTLRQSYVAYRSYADVARNLLEVNLHQIEKVIAASGIDPKTATAGYEAPSVEPPKNMKTDFRA